MAPGMMGTAGAGGNDAQAGARRWRYQVSSGPALPQPRASLRWELRSRLHSGCPLSVGFPRLWRRDGLSHSAQHPQGRPAPAAGQETLACLCASAQAAVVWEPPRQAAGTVPFSGDSSLSPALCTLN